MRKSFRIASALVLGAMAGVTVIAGIDRAGHALMAKGPFAQSARLADAGQQLASGGDARIAAQAVLLNDPLRFGAATYTAVARQQAGDFAGAQAMLIAALGLGWRDPAAQASAVSLALALDDPATAAIRAEGLLRAAPRSPLVPAVLAQIAENPAARAAFAKRIATGDAWTASLAEFGEAGDRDQIGIREILVSAAAAEGFRPDRTFSRRLASRMFDNNPAAAARLWTSLAGPGDSANHGLWQSGFGLLDLDEDDGSPGPFEWRVTPAGAGRISVSGHTLAINGSGGLAERLLSQRVAVTAGDYRLEWVGSGKNAGSPDVMVSAQCAKSGGNIRVRQVEAILGRYSRTITVSPQCPGIVIGLSPAPNSRTEARILRMRLVKL